MYQPGSRNFTADLLSRPEVEIKAVELHIQSCTNWKLEQSLDTTTRLIREYLSTEDREEVISEVVNFKEWQKILPSLFVENEILVFRDENVDKIVVPHQIIKLVLELHHDSKFAGHRDFEKTFSSIKSRYFWIHMHRDVKNYCATCHLCQTKKHLNSSYRAPLKPISINQPWMLIGIDVAGPLVKTPNGNSYIILAVDYFSKFCIAKATQDSTALSTAQFLFDDLICKFGMFQSIISDHGKNFKSILFAQLCQLCGIKPINSTFYHPEGNGLSERTIKTTKQILTMYVDVSHQNWDIHLQAAISAYNTSPHASIGCSPYEVVFARKPVVLADVVLSNRVNVDPQPLASYIKSLKEASAKIQDAANNQIVKSQARQKAYFDRFVQNSAKFCVGDLVLLVNERSIVGQSKSFRDRLIGPFEIVEMYNDVNYRLRDLKTNKVQDAHFNRLRPYRSRVHFIQSPTSSNIALSCQNTVIPNDHRSEINSFAVAQFLAIFRRSISAVRAPSTVASIEDEDAIMDLHSLFESSTESSSENEDEDDSNSLSGSEVTPEVVKTPCPVCSNEFKSVAIHIGKARDQAHMDYRASRLAALEELVV